MKKNNFEEIINEFYGILPTDKTIKEYENIENLLIEQTKGNKKMIAHLDFDEYLEYNEQLYDRIKDYGHITDTQSEYGHNIVTVKITNKEYFKDLNKQDFEHALAVIADHGNLCFGFDFIGKIAPNTYKIKVYID